MTTTTSTPAASDTASTAARRPGPPVPVRLLRRLAGVDAAVRWERPALLGLLAIAAALYVWDLAASGWANSFYSAAVQAGSVDWEAFFYGSSDASNSITVDKPPAALWIMALSVRLFGLSSWSILLPEALMGVATIAVVYATVRRAYAPQIALLAGGVLALTPVAALMFRFNNPDALLVLLLSLATYFVVRAIESGALRWVLLAGAMIGLGFLTKQLQAFLVLPVLAGVYLASAPGRWGRRILHALAALAAVVVSAGWWVAIVELVPADLRPYIGGSQTNSFLELTFGYNGLGRLTGDETGSVTGGLGGAAAGAGGMWGQTGILRLFEGEVGGQIAWLLPAALLLLVGALVVIGRARRGDPRRVVLLLMAGTLVVTGLAFSYMAGIFHAYYTVALAPALAGTIAIGAGLVWSRRSAWWARILLAVSVLVTGVWAWALLDRASSWLPWLKVVVLAIAIVAAVLVLMPPRGRGLATAAASAALTAALLAPAAYTLQTVTTAHEGSIVTAGPSVAGAMGGPGGGFGGGQGFGGGGQGFPGASQGGTGTSLPGLGGQGNGGVGGGQPPAGAQAPGAQNGTGQAGTGQAGTGQGVGAGAGGLLESSRVSARLSALLEKDAGDYRWVAAAIGSNSAAGYQLATGDPVMPIGGFNGSDPSPTLAQFQTYVDQGAIHYFIAGGVGRSNGGSDASSQIEQWVEETFTATTVDGVTLYDLTRPTS